MLSRVLILILMSSWLAACGGGGGGGGTDEPEVPDVTAPAAPSAPDLAAGSDTGLSATDNITSDNTPTFTGSGGVAGNTIKLYANGAEVGSGTVASNGSWSVTSSVLADSSYSVTARYINDADVQSAASAALNPLVIDTVAPAAPLVSSQSAAGVSGAAGAGDTITLYNESAGQVAQVSADNAGNWSFSAGSFPGETAQGFAGSVRATDLAGNEGAGTAIGPIDDQEPTLVTGRIVTGVVSDATVCASVFENDWISLGCTASDDQGYFGFDIEPQNGPVLLQATTVVSTLEICAAPAGCGEVAFGQQYSPEVDGKLQLLISGDQFAGDLAITPLTNMAAAWAMKVPGPLNDDVVALSLTRVADLFGLQDGFAAQLLPDITDSEEVAEADAAALEHALLAAGFSQLAATDSVSVAALNEQSALMFAWLGGQAWLQSGQIVLDDLAASVDLSAYPELEQWLSTIDYQAYPELLALADEYNTINYIGFDNLIAAANQVAVHIGAAVEFNDLVTRWGDNLVTTLGGATGFDATAFADATALLNRFEHYRDLSAAAQAELDPVTRQLAWLYADATSREQTVGMIQVLLEAIQFSLEGSICVPQRMNLQACNVEPPYADLKKIGITGNNYRVELRGSRYGQTVSINLPSTDIRSFLKNGTMDVPVTGTITNGSSVTTLNITLQLDITDNDLSGFNALSNLQFANTELLNPLLDALLADLSIEVTLLGNGSIASTNAEIGTYSFANLDASLSFNRRVLTQPETETGPMLTARVNSGDRTNPAGETLSSIDGEAALDLVFADPFNLDIAYAVQSAGLPEMEIRLGGDVAGTAPLVEVLANFIESALDSGVVLEEVDFDALLAQLDFSLLSGDGNASLTILDNVLGRQEYHFVASDTGLGISTLAGADPVLSLRVSGVAGYIYSGDTLVSTVHIGNVGEGVVLSLVDDSQRFYSGIDAGAALPFDSLLEFLTLLYEAYAPAPEELP